MEACISARCRWPVHKYARFLSSVPLSGHSNSAGDWEYFDSKVEKLILTVSTSDQLVLNQGDTVLESHCLSQSKAWMRGVAKGDSLLVLYKIKGQTRRFRVKFTMEEDCNSCQAELSRFFLVKTTQPGEKTLLSALTEDDCDSEDLGKVVTSSHPTRLTGEITLGKMAEVVSGVTVAELPEAYKHCHTTPEVTETFLRLCLTDPQFPAFVGHVESALEKIMKEASTD